MFRTTEELTQISNLPNGQLAEVPFAILLRAFAENRRTCVLEIRRRKLEKRIAIESGVPVACQSNLVHERFGPFLVGIGRLTEAEFSTSFSASITQDAPLGEILVEKGLVTLEELYRLLQQCLAKQLLDGFTWLDGEFNARQEEMAVPAPLKVKVHQLIFTGVTRFAPQSLVDGSVMTVIGQPLTLHPWPKPALEELRLDQAARAVVDVLGRGAKTLSEIGEAGELEIENVSRSVYALSVLGYVITEQACAEFGPEEGTITQPVPQLQFAPPTDLDKDEVLRLFLAHRRYDAFELLTLEEDSSVTEIEAAFLEFAKRFAPWSFEGGPLVDVREQSQELFLSAARAYGELADSEAREGLIYRRRLEAEQGGLAREEGGPSRIQTDLLDPGSQYRKGRTLMEAGEHKRALQYLEFASDCDPQNGLYRAELAYCRYLDDDKSAELVLKQLVETHRIDPTCGLAYLYAGEIAGTLGKYPQAETLLREASKLMAPDRRPIEKLKELSQLRR